MYPSLNTCIEESNALEAIYEHVHVCNNDYTYMYMYMYMYMYIIVI